MQALPRRRGWRLDAPEIRTDRLVLRALSPADAADLGRAMWTNRHHLAPWIDVPSVEPTVASVRRRMRWFADSFAAGTRLHYTLRDPARGALRGCIGLVPGRTAWTLSYWLVAAHTRRGYAREAVAALARLAFAHPWVPGLMIRCLDANHRSAAVARALGFTQTGARDGIQEWTLTRDRRGAIAALGRGPLRVTTRAGCVLDLHGSEHEGDGVVAGRARRSAAG